MKRSTIFLSAEQLIAAHAALLDLFGGEEGGGHRGPGYEGAEAAVQAVKNSYYDDLHELAAAYAVYVVQGHVFLDGNKRAGAAAMLVFLELNGVSARAPNVELAGRMIELQRRSEAGGNAQALIEWLAEWLRIHARPRNRRRRSGRRFEKRRRKRRVKP